jgi:hypothetical protein
MRNGELGNCNHLQNVRLKGTANIRKIDILDLMGDTDESYSVANKGSLEQYSHLLRGVVHQDIERSKPIHMGLHESLALCLMLQIECDNIDITTCFRDGVYSSFRILHLLW